MINFFIALFFSSLIVITFKIIDRYKLHLLTVVFVNYLTAVIIGFSATHGFFLDNQLFGLPWFPYALAGGVLFIITFLLMGLSTRHDGLAITSVAGKMSVVIPVIMGFWLLAEKAQGFKLFGIALALLAFYLTFASRSQESKKSLSRKIFPVLLFFSTGMGDSLIKYAQVNAIGNDFLPFLTVIFGVCLIAGIFMVTVQQGWQQTHWTSANMFMGIALGIFNWLSTIFLLKAMQIMEASVIFPAFNASIVAIASLTGVFIFKEKLKTINWIGVTLAILATLLVAST